MASDDDTPPLQAGSDIGQALKAERERQRLSLEEVADITRVRRAYLADLEEMRLDRLPSRPFTIGYIRAYAEALKLDGEAAVERFKSEEPDLDEPLRAPVGVGSQPGDPRAPAIVAGVSVILAAIILWNIAQRAMLANAPPSPTAPAKAAAAALAAQKSGPVVLGAPLPAPVESTTPPPYETPGLPTINPDGTVTLHPLGTKTGLPTDTQPAVDPATLQQVFQANGRIYGAAPNQPSAVTLQALKSASLIVRGAGGEIYFARQFAPGEAYRVPQVAGLTADVSQPASFQVFVGGRSKGVLPAPQVSLNKLAEQAPAPPAADAALGSKP